MVSLTRWSPEVAHCIRLNHSVDEPRRFEDDIVIVCFEKTWGFFETKLPFFWTSLIDISCFLQEEKNGERKKLDPESISWLNPKKISDWGQRFFSRFNHKIASRSR